MSKVELFFAGIFLGAMIIYFIREFLDIKLNKENVEVGGLNNRPMRNVSYEQLKYHPQSFRKQRKIKDPEPSFFAKLVNFNFLEKKEGKLIEVDFVSKKRKSL